MSPASPQANPSENPSVPPSEAGPQPPRAGDNPAGEPRWRVRVSERPDCVDVSLTLDSEGRSLVLELTDEQASLLSRDLILAADKARFALATRRAKSRR